MHVPNYFSTRSIGAEDQFERFKQDQSPEHQIYTFDFAGHGKSAPNPQFSIEFFADQLAEFCEGMDHYHIFGYSMGGYVALFAAALKRINPLSIITLGTKFDWYRNLQKRKRNYCLYKLYKNLLRFIMNLL